MSSGAYETEHSDFQPWRKWGAGAATYVKLFGGVFVRTEKVERDIRSVAYDPTVVTGRAGRDVEKRAGAQFVDGAVLHGSSSAAGDDQSDVLHIAARGTDRWPNVLGPLPARLIRGAADGHAADAHDFELALFKSTDFVGFFKTLEHSVQHGLPALPEIPQ
jgi:hypothetical protein